MKKIIRTILLILFIVIFRFIPHIPNATPLGYGVFNSSKNRGFFFGAFVLISALLISDILIGFYSPLLMVIVYFSFLIYALVGYLKKRNVLSLATPYLLALSAIFFYFSTNTAVWLTSNWYPKTPIGLLMCLIAGIPFFGAMIVGDFAFFLIHRAIIYTIWRIKKIWLFKKILLTN